MHVVDDPTATQHGQSKKNSRGHKPKRIKLNGKRKATSCSISQDVILHKAETPWKPKRKQDQTETEEDTKGTAVIYFYLCVELNQCKKKTKIIIQRMHIF